MLGRNNLLKLLAVLVVVTPLMIGWGALERVEGADLVPLAQETPPAEEPAPTEPPAEPEPTEPPPAGPEEPAPPEEPEAEAPGQGGLGNLGTLLTWGIAGLVGIVIVAVIVALVIRPGAGAEEVPELPSVPITTVAEDVKEGRVSKVVVRGEELTISRIDGLMMVSHKEPTADLVQLLTNLGVTPEMMSKIIIEVETPQRPIP